MNKLTFSGAMLLLANRWATLKIIDISINYFTKGIIGLNCAT